jgi:heptosyltransferase-3
VQIRPIRVRDPVQARRVTVSSNLSAPSRILVINVSRIGDTLLTTPVLRALARAWPQAAITFAGHPKRVEVMRHLPFLKRSFSISKTRARLMGLLGGKRFDLALVFGQDRPLVEYALRVSRRVVAFPQRDAALNRRLFAIANPEGRHPGHAVKLLLTMLEPLEIPWDGLHLSYRVTEREDRWARATLRRHGALGRPLIGLQVASFPTKGHRDWPLERFIELCEGVLRRHPGAHFVILGGTAERDRTRALHRRFTDRSTLFAGRLSLRQTAALMNQLDAYVGVDTGPTHIMGSLHRPLVALYHPTVPSRVLGALEHPCFFPVDHPLVDREPSDSTPMSAITAEVVLARLESALGWWRGRDDRRAAEAAA